MAIALTALALLGLRLFREDYSGNHFARSKACTWFAALGLLSATFADVPRIALYEWASFLLVIAVAATVRLEVSKSRERALDVVLLVLGLGSGLYLIRFLCTYVIYAYFGLSPETGDFIFGFENYRFFNHTQTVTLLLLTLLTLRLKTSLNPFWVPALVVTSGWWALLYFSAGRGTLAGVIVGGIAAAMVARRGREAWVKVLLGSALLGILLHLVLFSLVPQLLGWNSLSLLAAVGSRTIASPLSARDVLWGAAITMALDNPFLGVGPAHFAHNSSHLGVGAHPHSWILQIAAEWGLPALGCACLAIATGFRRLTVVARDLTKSEREQVAGAVLLGTGITIALDGLVSGLIVMPASQLWLCLYLGVAWGWVETSPLNRPEATVECNLRRSCLTPAVLTTVLLIFFWAGLVPEMFSLEELEKEALARGDYTTLFFPRIWRAGYF